jgi:HTH-type transcriptional regulator, sugar sensing transcriptional regulator
MNEVESALEGWGLSPKEIKTYIALLELGEATTVRLSEIININRTTLYDILNSLIDKGIVGATVKEKVKYFYASKPQALLEILKEKEETVKKVIPILTQKMRIIGKRPKIELYEGLKGIDSIHEDVLSNAKEILAFGSYAITGKVAEYQSLDFRKKRITKKIPITAITDKSAIEIEMLKQKNYNKMTKIYIDESLSKIHTWTYIYGNKVATLSFEKEQFFGFIIESNSVAEKERLLFNKILKSARRLKIQ